MSTTPVADVLGFAQQAREMLSTYKAQMTAKGFDPSSLMSALAEKATQLAAKNQEQEAAKTALRALTAEVDTIKDEARRTASAACDTILASFGRNSDQGKEATRLRKGTVGTRTARRSSKAPSP